MGRWTNWTKKAVDRRQRKRKAPRARLGVEVLEERALLSVAPGPDQHVILLSVDGLHGADVVDPALAPFLTNTLNLQSTGINYTNAHTTSPSDSFPGTLSYLTGAGPGNHRRLLR
jgi:hypothetical protein